MKRNVTDTLDNMLFMVLELREMQFCVYFKDKLLIIDINIFNGAQRQSWETGNYSKTMERVITRRIERQIYRSLNYLTHVNYK